VPSAALFEDYGFKKESLSNMKKFLSFIVSLMLTSVILTSCSISGSNDTSRHEHQRTELTQDVSPVLIDILESALDRRRAVTRLDHEYIYNHIDLDRRGHFVGRERERWGGIRERGITNEMASISVTTLFEDLALKYGPYYFLGGDDVFLPARNNMLDIISTQEWWTDDELTLLIYMHLRELITDGHFSIGGITLRGDTEFLQYNRPFTRSERGFMCVQSGLYVKQLILPCQPDMYLNLHDTFRFSMNEDGEFFYVPVIALSLPHYGRIQYIKDFFDPYVLAMPTAIEFDTVPYLVIVYDNDETEIVLLEILPRLRSFPRRATADEFQEELIPGSSLQFIYGFPVVTVEGMGFSHEQGHSTRSSGRTFLRYASMYLQNEPVIILDLRQNIGGCLRLPIRWMRSVTGQTVPISSIPIYNIPYESSVLWMGRGNYDNVLSLIPLGYGHTILDSGPHRIAPSNQLIVMLVDRGTVSAGELMVDLAFSMDNTLVIGQNTAGAHLTGYGMDSYLHFTNFSVRFADSFFLHPEGHFAEGIGFAPDIWVMGDALTATLNMLNNHVIRD